MKRPGPSSQREPESEFQRRVLAFFHERLPGREGYEDRPEQRRMALAVARTIEEEGILVAEAGTGTGKSLAYLIPSLLWAAERDMPVIVSTRTLNLQQQLLDHDLPGLSSIFGRPFKAVAARGWGNYVCLRRARSLSGSIEPALAPALEALEEELSHGASGIRQEMRTDDRLWPSVCAESLSCSRQICPFYEGCYFFRDRREMARADLIVTNHSLLLADLALRREGASGILPAPACIILDEGHHLEDVANEYLARGLSTQDMARLQQQLYVPGGKQDEAGLLPVIRNRVASLSVATDVKRALLSTVDRELLGSVPSLYSAAEGFFAALSSLIRPVPGDETGLGRMALTPELMQTEAGGAMRQCGALLGQHIERTAASVSALQASLQDVRELVEGSLEELQAMTTRLKSLSRNLEFCLFPDSPDWVYWMLESPGRNDNPSSCAIGATPLDVGETLARDFFAPARSVVITSATLAVAEDLSFYASRVGLDRVEDRVETLCLDSPFDFRRQAYLGVANDLPEPGSPDFVEAMIEPLCNLVEQLRGRTFLLLTSMTLLRRMAHLLRQRLSTVRVLAQGEASNRDLLRTFKAGPPALLLGADSFWEGVDVSGDALQCVVLGRLPFRVPTDPLVQAHCKRLEDNGQSSFYGYQLPRAILRFRQGFGRLIRSRLDRGMVMVLDSRIYHKSYGAEFRKSVPACTRRAGPWAELVEDSLSWMRDG